MSDVETETDENDDLKNKNLDKDNVQEENEDDDDLNNTPKRDFNMNSEKKREKSQLGTNDQNNEIEMDDETKNDEDDENGAKQQESKLSNDNLGRNNQVSRENLEKDSEDDDGEDSSNETEKQMGQKNENRVQSDDKKELNEKNFNILNENENDNETNKENRLENENDTELDSAKKNKKRDFKHIKNADEKFDASVYDAATESQKRKIDQQQDKQFDEDIKSNSNKKRHLEKEEPLIENENDPLKPKKTDDKKNKKKNTNESNETEDVAKEIKEEMEPMSTDDFVTTLGVDSRPLESLYNTAIEKFEFKKTREELELELKQFRETENFKFTNEPDLLTSDSIKLWLEYEALTQQLSKELCEQLRLILEPTVCSKLKGDYKTGKRLNMKRVVEYIATEYRKDKIWLRRTKPNKRDYEILLAVDNSCSMGDNHCIQLAYETIATLSNAFQYLEVGKFGLLSFGENVNQLVDLQEQFNSDIGAKILSRVNFKDDKTKVAQVKFFFNKYLIIRNNF
jgi:midasin